MFVKSLRLASAFVFDIVIYLHGSQLGEGKIDTSRKQSKFQKITVFSLTIDTDVRPCFVVTSIDGTTLSLTLETMVFILLPELLRVSLVLVV